MRSILIVLLLLPAAEPAKKAAWQWTIEERLAARLDPENRRQRLERDRKNRDTRFYVTVMVGEPQQPSVDGALEPELFLPSELFAHAMWLGDDDESTLWYRRRLTQGLVALGYDPDAFWKTFGELTAEYRAFSKAGVAADMKIPTATPPERRRLEQEREERAVRGCRMRSELMPRVRAALGGETFDRFLYVHFAPTISVSSANVPTEEERILRYVEGGCR